MLTDLSISLEANPPDFGILSRLRVLSVSSLYPTQSHPQYGVFVQRRLKALAEHVDVSVLRPVPWFPFYRPYSAGERSQQNGLQVADHRMFYLPKFMKHWDSDWLKRCVEPQIRLRKAAGEVDLIDAHFGFPTGVGCVNAARRLELPVFVTIRGVEQEELREPAIRKRMVEGLNRATGCIAVSDVLKKEVVAAGVREENVKVIPNAVDSEAFGLASRDPAREHLGIPVDRSLIVCVGNLKRVKRHEVLIKAVQKTMSEHSSVHLAILGATVSDNGYTTELMQLVRDLNLENVVTFAGEQSAEDVAKWLHAADVFSLATAREGCCNAVLEALACGRPVVTTPAGDNERYVDPPRNGLIVPFDDPQALADGLCDALEREWDEEAISHSVRTRGWDDVARETIEFFEERLELHRSTQTKVTVST